MTDTPETDGEWNRLACQDHPEFERNLADFARKMERERDEWKAKYIQQNKDLRCEQMDPNGTIWDYAKELQAKLDEARKWSATLADAGDEIRAQLREEQQLHVQTLNERDEALGLADRRAALLQQDRDGYGIVSFLKKLNLWKP